MLFKRRGRASRRDRRPVAPDSERSGAAPVSSRERLDFKRDVRKLKNLCLTESLEVGYRLSPLGRALLKRRR